VIKDIKNKNGKKDFAGGFSTDYNIDDFDDAFHDMTTPMYYIN